ncbi:hypothetical protein AJ79_09285 [Helicocarpus griseus UAMH5409]|uniref:Zn(2)-C6 fungal-type domain-containing protein n=1 Tax=Helicocarpus griseus UAMH5409 TaxID=1447875 RepID=A0A2B7WL45_9EURO|nr:hypothetical protein AJ79_09285 [Helicocarpus griseus UAMH5409]
MEASDSQQHGSGAQTLINTDSPQYHGGHRAGGGLHQTDTAQPATDPSDRLAPSAEKGSYPSRGIKRNRRQADRGLDCDYCKENLIKNCDAGPASVGGCSNCKKLNIICSSAHNSAGSVQKIFETLESIGTELKELKQLVRVIATILRGHGHGHGPGDGLQSSTGTNCCNHLHQAQQPNWQVAPEPAPADTTHPEPSRQVQYNCMTQGSALFEEDAQALSVTDFVQASGWYPRTPQTWN